MSDMPIMFLPRGIEDILAGRKTQTRRRVKPPASMIGPYPLQVNDEGMVDECGHFVRCPYGGVGDTMWVRESFRLDKITYKVGGEELTKKVWKHGRTMPRILARIFLEITGINVERLHDISEEDAIAEGSTLQEYPAIWNACCDDVYAWGKNPMVWVITFRRI